jgi:hypothetical protein
MGPWVGLDGEKPPITRTSGPSPTGKLACRRDQFSRNGRSNILVTAFNAAGAVLREDSSGL